MSGDPEADKIFQSLGSLFKLALNLEKDSYVGRLNFYTVTLAVVFTAVLSASPVLEVVANAVLAYKSGASQVAESKPFDFSVLLWWFLFMAGCMVMVTATHIYTEKQLNPKPADPGSRKIQPKRKNKPNT
jgi:hypothetical protein